VVVSPTSRGFPSASNASSSRARPHAPLVPMVTPSLDETLGIEHALSCLEVLHEFERSQARIYSPCSLAPLPHRGWGAEKQPARSPLPRWHRSLPWWSCESCTVPIGGRRDGRRLRSKGSHLRPASGNRPRRRSAIALSMPVFATGRVRSCDRGEPHDRCTPLTLRWEAGPVRAASHHL